MYYIKYNYFNIFDTAEKKNAFINYVSTDGQLIYPYIDGQSGASFLTHPLKEFLKICSEKDPFYQYFLGTTQGKLTMNTIIKNAETIDKYEELILPNIGKWVNSCYLDYKLQSTLEFKNDKKRITKI